MSKKVKCNKCSHFIEFSLPCNITEDNFENIKYCLNKAIKCGCCEWTMKTKLRTNEQYCKHFCMSETNGILSKHREEEVNKLKKIIEKYEIAKREGK